MKRGLIRNKKGQGIFSSTSVGVILAVLVLVVVALVLMYLFGVFTEVKDIAPDVSSAKAKLCITFSSDAVSFCEFTPVKFGSDEGYINCNYDENLDFKKTIDEMPQKPNCSETSERFCLSKRNELGKDKADLLKVNSKEISCGERLANLECPEGTLTLSVASCPTNNFNLLGNSGVYCCLN